MNLVSSKYTARTFLGHLKLNRNINEVNVHKALNRKCETVFLFLCLSRKLITSGKNG